MKKTAVLAALLAAVTAGLTGLQAQESVTAKYKVNFYGHIKNDFILDSAGVDGHDYSYYVYSEKVANRDFRASAKGTRLGMDITDGDKISAKFETDFLGDDTSNAGMRLRHAYVTLKSGKYEILSGQTWMLTPLELSGTNNEFAMGYSGVLWMRAPQLRVTHKCTDNMTSSVAIVRPTRVLTDNNGTASGLPQAQAQVQYKFGKAKFTLMGAYGKWRDTTTGKLGEVQLADLGYNVPLNSFLTLNGQLWTGQNLYDFLGGIGQMGYGTDEVRASGGFANLSIKPAGKFSYNLAYGVDNPVDADLAASASLPTSANSTTAVSRAKNSTLMANVNYLAYEKVTITLEASQQQTEYKLASGNETLENLHYQLSFKFPF